MIWKSRRRRRSSRPLHARPGRCRRTGPCRRWDDSAAGWPCPQWSCRSRIHRPARSVCPVAIARSTPSTALTWPDDAPQHALVDREMHLEAAAHRAAGRPAPACLPGFADSIGTWRIVHLLGRKMTSVTVLRRAMPGWQTATTGVPCQFATVGEATVIEGLIEGRHDARDHVQAQVALLGLGHRAEKLTAVGVLRVSRKTSATSFISISCPAYMTPTRSAISATTPRSCVISRIAIPVSRCSCLQQVEHLRLDGDIERGRRFVGNQQLRSPGQRHRDHDTLFHATGQLVGVFVHTTLRVRYTDRAEQLHHPRIHPAPAFGIVQAHRLRDLLTDRSSPD